MRTKRNGNNRNNKNKQTKPAIRGKVIIRRRQTRRQIPAAQTMSAPKRFQNIKTTGTTATVSGCDLVYQIPDTLTSAYQNTNVITMIPCNPAYWSGTRIAAVAAGYQNYRPVQFDVIYIPQCAVTQQGNVLGGTLWNQAPSTENLQQTLKTSNGGILTQCYQSKSAKVKLGTNLQYNLYRMGGAIDQESNPFIYIALGIATTNNQNAKIIPGYFYVRYTYIFKNPVGTGIQYANSQLIHMESKSQYLLNAVAYTMESVRTANGLEIPVGSRIDIEYNNNAERPGYNYLYNGTLIDLGILATVWVLENQPHSITTNLNAVKKTKDVIRYESANVAQEEPVYILPGEGITYETTQDYDTLINLNQSYTTTILLDPGTVYYRIMDIYQNFGKIIDLPDTESVLYKAAQLWTQMLHASTKTNSDNQDLKDNKNKPTVIRREPQQLNKVRPKSVTTERIKNE
jgi:hypothetical protein